MKAVAVGALTAASLRKAGIRPIYAASAGLLTTSALWLMWNRGKPSVSDAVLLASGIEPSEVGIDTANRLIRQGMNFRDAVSHGALASIQANASHESIPVTISNIVVSRHNDPSRAGSIAASITSYIRGASLESVTVTAAIAAGAAALRSGIDPSAEAFSAAMDVINVMIQDRSIISIAERTGQNAVEQKQSPIRIGETISDIVVHKMARNLKKINKESLLKYEA